MKIGRDTLVSILSEFEGRSCEITVSPVKKSRSRSQNDYYWGVIIPCMQTGVEETWGDRITKEEAHFMLKDKLLFDERVVRSTGEVVRVPKHTTANSTVEQEIYHEDCRNKIEEWFGVRVPLPKEDMEIEFGYAQQGEQ